MAAMGALGVEVRYVNGNGRSVPAQRALMVRKWQGVRDVKRSKRRMSAVAEIK